MRRFLARFLAALACATAVGMAADKQAVAGEKRATPVGVGESAPDFTLEDQDGRKHTLSAERGKRAVVLVFYRGYFAWSTSRSVRRLLTYAWRSPR